METKAEKKGTRYIEIEMNYKLQSKSGYAHNASRCGGDKDIVQVYK